MQVLHVFMISRNLSWAYCHLVEVIDGFCRDVANDRDSKIGCFLEINGGSDVVNRGFLCTFVSFV